MDFIEDCIDIEGDTVDMYIRQIVYVCAAKKKNEEGIIHNNNTRVPLGSI